jgi:TolB-like protein
MPDATLAVKAGEGHLRRHEARILEIGSEGSSPAKAAAVPSGRFRERGALWIVSVINALAMAGLLAWQFRPHTGVPGSRASVAVLPFADFSPTHDMKSFTDGIANQLMNSLDSAGSLRVIGRGTAFAFMDTNEDARAIGAKLDVDSILEGSVRKAGERIRISVRLVGTQDGLSLWSETYDLEPGDMLDIQSAIASEVTARLHHRKI